MMKKCILGFITCLSLFGLSFAQVTVNPIYTSERFQPSDKFHAGCENQIDVVFQLNNSKINGVNAVLEYDSDDVEVLKVLAVGERENNLSYTVEKDRIVFSKLKTEGEGLDSVTFTLFFKVGSDLKESSFSFAKGSYVVDLKGNMIELEGNYSFQFTEVPECDPDIVAPSVELLFPSNKIGEYVALDSYFQFEIDDSGKGINEKSINFSIDGFDYTLATIEHEWEGKILTIYPDIRMPFNTGFEVKISVSDKQSYGKPNTTTKLYEFQTSDTLNLLNDIDPVEFRKIVNLDKYFKGTKDECKLLSELYSQYFEENGEILESINTKLECDELAVVERVGNIDIIQENDDENLKFSVFSMLGWIMFGCLFFAVVFGRLGKK